MATRTAEAIVVGGGVNGTSTAFHLAERGVHVVLLDRGEIAGASTGKSGGLVRMHYTNPHEARLANESLPYFTDWRRRIGVGDPGFSRTGFVQTVTPQNVDALRANVRMLQSVGVNTCVVNRDDVRKLAPYADVDDQTACAYEPDSGCAMPGQTAQGFAEAATRFGAEIVTGSAVTALRVAGGRVVGISTETDEWSASLVIVCAGVWSVPLFRAVGVELPIVPHRTQVVLFRRQGNLPEGAGGHMVFIDAALGSYFRPYGETETLIGVRQRSRAVASADEYTESADADIIADSKQTLARRVPDMEGAAVTRHWAGILDMTPDTCPILESHLGAQGLFLAAGFSGSGFKSGPYVGKLMADWAATDEQPEDAAPFDLARFAEGRPIVPEHPYVSDSGAAVVSVPH